MILQEWLIIILGLLVGVGGQIAYLLIVDHEKVRESKRIMKDLQIKLKSTPVNDPQFRELQNQLLMENAKVMRQTMKPTYITFVPFLILFILAEFYLSTVPIAIGMPVNAQFVGNFSGNITSSCFMINHNLSQSLAIKNGMSFNATILSDNCTIHFVQAGKISNLTLSGVIGSIQQKKFTVDNLSLQINPNPLVIVTLPFSIPILGNQLNWFWTYILISLVSGLIMNRILIHFKLIA